MGGATDETAHKSTLCRQRELELGQPQVERERLASRREWQLECWQSGLSQLSIISLLPRPRV